MTVNVNIAPTVNIAAGSSGSGEGMMIASAVAQPLEPPRGPLARCWVLLRRRWKLATAADAEMQASMAVEAGEPHQRLIGQHHGFPKQSSRLLEVAMLHRGDMLQGMPAFSGDDGLRALRMPHYAHPASRS